MIAILIFMAGLAVIISWWVYQQRLMSKPWLETGRIGELPQRQGSQIATAKIGLGFFLAVVGALFTLLISAYLIRMNSPDWWSVPVPLLLWLNTAVLAANSVALQWAKIEARHGHPDTVNAGLIAGCATGALFLCGQFVAWRQLMAAGYVLADNPANSFFYMITGLHGLHILGGLYVLGRTSIRARRGIAGQRLTLSVELCAMYWHFMLIVWLVLFALLTGWANSFADLCRQLV
jgi:cytochrome c oxidase subunit 3